MPDIGVVDRAFGRIALHLLCMSHRNGEQHRK
jgi:hypothetical protein